MKIDKELNRVLKILFELNLKLNPGINSKIYVKFVPVFEKKTIKFE
jgi:hypothetical protein